MVQSIGVRDVVFRFNRIAHPERFLYLNFLLNLIVDGGALSNFPIDKLTSDESSVRAVMGDKSPNRNAVTGQLIDEKLMESDMTDARKNSPGCGRSECNDKTSCRPSLIAIVKSGWPHFHPEVRTKLFPEDRIR